MKRLRGHWRVWVTLGVAVVIVVVVGFGAPFERVFNNGIQITRADWHAIQIDNSSWAGVWVNHSGYDAFQASHPGRHGLHIEHSGDHAIKVETSGGHGILVHSAKSDGIHVSSAGHDGICVQSAANDCLKLGDPGPGHNYIIAFSGGRVDFLVEKGGKVWSRVGYTSAPDFAELLPTDGDPEVYEPGDVLVISAESDRAVALSSTPYSTAVIGVYSTNPGFVGSSHQTPARREDEIPVAIMGIVPCKVSAENGAIHRGDLLTTSGTPGHAMKATEGSVGTILGKALGDAEVGTGVIDVLLTLQ